MRWDDSRIQLSAILKAVSDIGYLAHPFDPARSDDMHKRERNTAIKRLAVAGLGSLRDKAAQRCVALLACWCHKAHRCNIHCMKSVNWSTEKNIRLKAERGVSFEEVVSAMSNGGLLVVLDHPNTVQYPNQRMFVVRIRGYAYLVPFVETKHEVFLKTIIPSRKATRIYIDEEH